MAFTSSRLVIENENKESIEQPITAQSVSELSLVELEFLLKVIGNADLKGHQVEMFYNMALKLQNQYIAKSK
jgi:hypothetical protein